MKHAAFQELMSSIRQAGRIRGGTMKPGRATVFKPEDVKAVRASLGASQSELAEGLDTLVVKQGRRVWAKTRWRLQTHTPQDV